MKKFAIIIFCLVFALTFSSLAMAKGKNGPAGNSNVGHLYLYEKTSVPLSDPWVIVEGGAWGKMKYNLSGSEFDFVFNGHGLPVGQLRTLIYYPDPWPGEGLICLGSGVVDAGGNIHIAASVDTGDLPIVGDDNAGPTPPLVPGYPGGETGAKIFLVPSGDVDCDAQEMIGWTESANLYEGALISFTEVP